MYFNKSITTLPFNDSTTTVRPENTEKLDMFAVYITATVLTILVFVFIVASFKGWIRKLMNYCIYYRKIVSFPSKEFRKGNLYTICLLCLQEYEDKDRLRILPCLHAYHNKCVIKHLLCNNGRCPICLEDVFNYHSSIRSDLRGKKIYGTSLVY